MFFPRAQACYFYDAESHDEATWDRPSGSCVVHWHAPAVPHPWVVRRNDVTGELSFWNKFYVLDGVQTVKRKEEVPGDFPPTVSEYEPRRAADGCWDHVNVATLDACRYFMPGAPEGWCVDWSPAQQDMTVE